MVTMERINVRGAINELGVKDEPLTLDKTLYKLSTVRATAGAITGDTGKTFSVTTEGDNIVIIRNS